LDIATIAGLLTGVTLILLAIVSGSPITTFIHIPSMMITIGGATAAAFINFPLKTMLGVVAIVKKTVLCKMPSATELIAKVVKYAEKARKEGMLALEDESETEEDEFLRLGLRLAVDGTDPQLLQKIMENDIIALQRRHEVGIGVITSLGTFAPAFGMIGTLVGLVQMLSNMSSPDGIGAGMAVALLTTFYGAFMANVFFLPLAGKLRNRSQEELMLRDLIVEGITSIQTGDSPRVVEEKLKSFLAPKEREALGKKDAA
jgi:chemotaxis protein MotA